MIATMERPENPDRPTELAKATFSPSDVNIGEGDVLEFPTGVFTAFEGGFTREAVIHWRKMYDLEGRDPAEHYKLGLFATLEASGEIGLAGPAVLRIETRKVGFRRRLASFLTVTSLG